MGIVSRAFRNLSRRKIRALLVVIAIGFSMAIMISIPAGIVANQEAAQNLAENYNSMISSMQEEINKTATLMECRTGRGPSGVPSAPTPIFGQHEEVFVNETVVDEIRSIEGVKDVVEFLEIMSDETTSETISGPGGRTFTLLRPLYTITGVSLNSSFIDNYSILPTNVTAGEPLQQGDSGVVLMSSNLSDYYSKGVGDTIEIYGESFTIVGIYEPTSQGLMAIREVYMSLSDAQTITDNAGNVSRLDVYAEGVSYVDGIADVIEAYSEAYDLGLYVTTYKDRLENLKSMQEMYNTTLENADSTLAQTQTIATQEIIIAVVATSLIVLFVMLYTVRERTKEIGILKAIGFSNFNVMSQFMLEGTLISIVAGVVGIAIGIVGAPILTSLLLPSVNLFPTQESGGFGGQTMNFGTTLTQSAAAAPDLQTMLLAFGVAVLLGAIGSLYPAWRASRTSPMEALRYE